MRVQRVMRVLTAAFLQLGGLWVLSGLAQEPPAAEAFEDKTAFLQSLLDRGEGIVRFPDGRFAISRALEITDGDRR